MIKTVKAVCGFIHATLILAIILPVVYAIGRESDQRQIVHMFLFGMLFLIPVVITWYADTKVHSLMQYLIWCVGAGMIGLLCMAGVQKMMGIQGSQEKANLGIQAFLMVLLGLDRMLGWWNEKQKEKAFRRDGSNARWTPLYHYLMKPGFLGLLYFLAVYVIGKSFCSTSLCNEALFASILYFFAALFYRYMDQTEKYLMIHKGVCNLPYRRIVYIGAGMTVLMALVALICMIPSIVTIRDREYSDYNQWVAERKVEMNQDEVLAPADGGGASHTEIEQKPPKDMPLWNRALFGAIAVAVFVCLALFVWKHIRISFSVMQRKFDENGDVIEDLKKKEQENTDHKRKKKSRREMTPKELIRYDYKKTVRKYRKDVPGSYETPGEIESIAGIDTLSNGKEIHETYEQARYGK